MDVPKYIHVRIGLTDAVILSVSSSPMVSCTICTSSRSTPPPSAGRTNSGALPALPTVRPSTLHTTILIPTGVLISNPIGITSAIICGPTASTNSTQSSAVPLLHTSTNKIMSKIKVTINLEHMSLDEQMRFFIRLADEGLLPPCPPEIRQKYEKPADK